ncbi:MAG: hypothetical protein WKF83_08755 [Nocardioidaceae bacterium]
MRDSLASLTIRGRAFIAAGVTTTVCSILLGFDALMRVGILAVALPLITAIWVGRTRYRLMAARTVQPGRVSMGEHRPGPGRPGQPGQAAGRDAPLRGPGAAEPGAIGAVHRRPDGRRVAEKRQL